MTARQRRAIGAQTGLGREQAALFRQGIEQLALSLSCEQFERMTAYLEMVEKWRRKMNLVSVRNARELITHHALDSLALAPFVRPAELLLDIGTGAGFPGMLLAMACPGSVFHLLDSRQRRIEFLRLVQSRAGLENLFLHCARVENLAGEIESADTAQLAVQPLPKFDTLIARAVASLAQLVSMTTPLRVTGQRLLAMKGRYPEAELERLHKTCSDQIESIRVEELRVPFLEAERHLVIIQF